MSSVNINTSYQDYELSPGTDRFLTIMRSNEVIRELTVVWMMKEYAIQREQVKFGRRKRICVVIGSMHQ